MRLATSRAPDPAQTGRCIKGERLRMGRCDTATFIASLRMTGVNVSTVLEGLLKGGWFAAASVLQSARRSRPSEQAVLSPAQRPRLQSNRDGLLFVHVFRSIAIHFEDIIRLGKNADSSSRDRLIATLRRSMNVRAKLDRSAYAARKWQLSRQSGSPE